MSSPLPEIREGDAQHEIEVIYADIRHSLRLPLVTYSIAILLRFRACCLMPGDGGEKWRFPSPRAALDRFNRSLQVPQLEPFELPSLAHMSHVDRAAIKRALEAYNRGNGSKSHRSHRD